MTVYSIHKQQILKFRHVNDILFPFTCNLSSEQYKSSPAEALMSRTKSHPKSFKLLFMLHHLHHLANQNREAIFSCSLLQIFPLFANFRFLFCSHIIWKKFESRTMTRSFFFLICGRRRMNRERKESMIWMSISFGSLVGWNLNKENSRKQRKILLKYLNLRKLMGF